MAATFHDDLTTLVRAIVQLDGISWIAETVFGTQHERAAQRIEPEHRIGAGIQRHRGNGLARNQVPAHDIAERLVETNAIHVDRHALRRAQQRRRGIAAIVDVGLQRVVLHVVHVHAAQRAIHERADVECMRTSDILGRRRLHCRGDSRAIHFRPRQRSRADNHNGREVCRLRGQRGGRHGRG